MLAYLVLRFLKDKKVIFSLIIIAYLFFNLTSSQVNFKAPTGMPPGVTIDTYQDIAQTITADEPKNFNLAVLLDFDTLGRPLRYLLTYVYQQNPRGYADYQDVDALYVFAENDYNMEKPQVWELKTYQPYQKEILKDYFPNHTLYKLNK